MKKLVCILLVLALFCAGAGAESKILTKAGIRLRLEKAFEEKAESIELNCSAMLFSSLVEEGLSSLALMAWQAGIVYYDWTPSVRSHTFTLTGIRYTDTEEPLPYTEIHNEEEFAAAVAAYAEEKEASYGIFCSDIDLWEQLADTKEFERQLFRHGLETGMSATRNYFFIILNAEYVDYPTAEAVGIDGFREAVAAFREQGIRKFCVALDSETMESYFGKDVSTQDIAITLFDAGILYTKAIEADNDYCFVTIEVARYSDKARQSSAM